MQKILGYMRKAITDYQMLEDGDRVAVGVSGGKDSVVLLEQLRTIDKLRLKGRIGSLDPERMREVDEALLMSLGIQLG